MGKSLTKLAQIIRATNGIITAETASKILKKDRHETSVLLRRWENQGWLSRIKHGVYTPVPLESQGKDIGVTEPWLLAQTLFSPCYIGGFSAAEYWDLTEQVFNSILVMTTKRVARRNSSMKGVRFQIRTIKAASFFGLRSVWKGGSKVQISDPSRTILDLFYDPRLGGGIRSTLDIFQNYMRSNSKDLPLLIDYGLRLASGATFKRLGFAIEMYFPDETLAIGQCRKAIKSGYTQLDPQVPSRRLVSNWNLWVPEAFLKKDKI